ncbi:sugar phosphate isomerase/epimerase family protein [Salipaludibacillus sp. HK11]|uniref:sugar phosphate isomerase/epimerase family protein n=1 Tax=Salipaludibacillus sp. HK11 TaxID=3394320 RepID=UPI0039FD25AA
MPFRSLDANDHDDTVASYKQAADDNNIIVAEVGAWSNPISPDNKVRAKALEHCKSQLDLAERMGAACCVNIAGGRGSQWDGPHEENFSSETFNMIVDSVREIHDAIKPKWTTYALEMMPWIFPDSAETYQALIKAIDRKGFSVHFDPVNMINSPRDYYRNSEIIGDFVKKLGPWINNVHAKDIKLHGNLTVHLDEVIPGQGALNYRRLLTELNMLNKDISIIIEHLGTEAEYNQARKYIRHTSAACGINL